MVELAPATHIFLNAYNTEKGNGGGISIYTILNPRVISLIKYYISIRHTSDTSGSLSNTLEKIYKILRISLTKRTIKALYYKNIYFNPL